ncbi:hypothetical protein D3C75_740710 [compost metagenome]
MYLRTQTAELLDNGKGEFFIFNQTAFGQFHINWTVLKVEIFQRLLEVAEDSLIG